MRPQPGIEREVALRLPSFLGVARIVAQTELLVVVPRLLGETLASQAAIKLLDPPVALPSYAVKQHWHDRFHADPGNAWLRRTLAELFSKPSRSRANPPLPHTDTPSALDSKSANTDNAYYLYCSYYAEIGRLADA